jgi:hypothetical protein
MPTKGDTKRELYGFFARFFADSNSPKGGSTCVPANGQKESFPVPAKKTRANQLNAPPPYPPKFIAHSDLNRNSFAKPALSL